MAGPAVRVSTDANGAQANGYSTAPVYLANNSTVVFYSQASNLVAGDTNGRPDVFAKDLASGAITKLTPDALDQTIASFSISPDGKTLAFTADIPNPGDVAVYGRGLFTLDVASGAVTLVARNQYLAPVDPAPVFSSDGRKLAFASSDGTLVAGDTNDRADVFVKDLVTGAVTRVSTTATGAQAVTPDVYGTQSGSYQPFFSADGSKVLFTSQATNLVAGDTNGRADIFVKDLAGGAIASVPTKDGGYRALDVSPDGGTVLAEISAYGRGGIPGVFTLVAIDTITGAERVIDRNTTGYGSGSFGAEFSPDGTKVVYTLRVYEGGGSGLATTPTQVFVKDLATDVRVSFSGYDEADYSSAGTWSPDGKHLAFASGSARIVAGDTNGTYDVFARDLFSPVFGQRVTDAAGNGGKVFALYEGLLGRAPDSLGLEVNTGAVNAGASLRDLAAAFLASPEGQARSGAATDQAFVTQFYRTTLGREPDQAGLDNYVSYLGAGGSRADVAVGFALSPEYLTKLAPTLAAGVIVNDAQAAQAARLYYAVFDRAPDAGGLGYWTGYLKGGGSLAGAAQAFVDGAESKAAGSTSNATFVNALYVNALDRPAEAAGLAGWVDYLDHGGSRGAVAAAIANSVEAQIHLTGVIENGWFLSA